MDKLLNNRPKTSRSKPKQFGVGKRATKDKPNKKMHKLISCAPDLYKINNFTGSNVEKAKFLIDASTNLVSHHQTSKNLNTKKKPVKSVPENKNILKSPSLLIKSTIHKNLKHINENKFSNTTDESSSSSKRKVKKNKETAHHYVKQRHTRLPTNHNDHKSVECNKKIKKKSKADLKAPNFSMPKYKQSVSNSKLSDTSKKFASELTKYSSSSCDLSEKSFKEFNQSTELTSSSDEGFDKSGVLCQAILKKITKDKRPEPEEESDSEECGKYVRPPKLNGLQNNYSESDSSIDSDDSEDSENSTLLETVTQTQEPIVTNGCAKSPKPTMPDTQTLNNSGVDTSIVEINSDSEDDDIPKSTLIVEKNTFFEIFVGLHKNIIKLNHPCKMYFNGKLDATLLFGNVKVLGYELRRDKTSSIYSPKGTASLCFETCKDLNEFNPLILFKKLESSGLTPYEIERIVTSVGKNDAVLYVDNINNSLTKTLANVQQQMFPTINSIIKTQSAELQRLYEKKMLCKFYVPGECPTPFVEDPTWNQIDFASLAQSGTRIMVCGGKGVGKSTFVRYCTNKIIRKTSVIIIDLDIGQSECFLPGTISVSECTEPLLGPSFTHIQTELIKSIFIREIDVLENPNSYINSIKILLDFLKKQYSNKPWIINTMGFSKTLGEDLIVALIKLINPTNVVQINNNMKHRNFSVLLKRDIVNSYTHGLKFNFANSELNYEYVLLKSELDKSISNVEFKPKLSRELNIFGYFSPLMLGDDIKSITSANPKLLSLSDTKIWACSSSKSSIITKELNGSLVALCSVDEDVPVIKEGGLQFLPNDMENAPECVGFGIVRGIDITNNNICVITTLSNQQISNVTCIATCVQKLPESLFLNHIPAVKGQIPFVTGARIRLSTGNTPKRSYIGAKKFKNGLENN